MSEPPAGQSSDLGAAPLGEPGQTPAPDVGSVEPADPLEPYRRWATTLFAILVVVGVVGTVVVLGAIPGLVVFWALLASVVLLIAILLAVIVALRRRDAWAVHAIAPICYVIIVAAVLRVLVALSQGDITIPLEGIGALMVLTRNHRSESMPAITEQGKRRVWLAVAGVVVAQLLPVATGPIADGGAFGLQPESLNLQVTMDCTTLEPAAGIPVRAEWSWRDREVLSPPIDGLVVRWSASSDVVADQVTMSHHAMFSGSGDPAAALIQPLTQDVPSREFGIDLAQAGLIDGSVELMFVPTDETATSGSFAVWAAYAHGDRWLKESDTASCSW